MEISRLKLLADKLDTVQPFEFNLGVWFRQNDCGTVGCAVGWACQVPELQEEGLHLKNSIPIYQDRYAWEAVLRFFNLNEDEAAYLFMPLSYDHRRFPKDVADRIRNFIKGE
jgi:hypothetical protein